MRSSTTSSARQPLSTRSMSTSPSIASSEENDPVLSSSDDDDENADFALWSIEGWDLKKVSSSCSYLLSEIERAPTKRRKRQQVATDMMIHLLRTFPESGAHWFSSIAGSVASKCTQKLRFVRDRRACLNLTQLISSLATSLPYVARTLGELGFVRRLCGLSNARARAAALVIQRTYKYKYPAVALNATERTLMIHGIEHAKSDLCAILRAASLERPLWTHHVRLFDVLTNGERAEIAPFLDRDRGVIVDTTTITQLLIHLTTRFLDDASSRIASLRTLLHLSQLPRLRIRLLNNPWVVRPTLAFFLRRTDDVDREYALAIVHELSHAVHDAPGSLRPLLSVLLDCLAKPSSSSSGTSSILCTASTRIRVRRVVCAVLANMNEANVVQAIKEYNSNRGIEGLVENVCNESVSPQHNTTKVASYVSLACFRVLLSVDATKRSPLVTLLLQSVMTLGALTEMPADKSPSYEREEIELLSVLSRVSSLSSDLSSLIMQRLVTLDAVFPIIRLVLSTVSTGGRRRVLSSTILKWTLDTPSLRRVILRDDDDRARSFISHLVKLADMSARRLCRRNDDAVRSDDMKSLRISCDALHLCIVDDDDDATRSRILTCLLSTPSLWKRWASFIKRIATSRAQSGSNETTETVCSVFALLAIVVPVSQRACSHGEGNAYVCPANDIDPDDKMSLSMCANLMRHIAPAVVHVIAALLRVSSTGRPAHRPKRSTSTHSTLTSLNYVSLVPNSSHDKIFRGASVVLLRLASSNQTARALHKLGLTDLVFSLIVDRMSIDESATSILPHTTFALLGELSRLSSVRRLVLRHHFAFRKLLVLYNITANAMYECEDDMTRAINKERRADVYARLSSITLILMHLAMEGNEANASCEPAEVIARSGALANLLVVGSKAADASSSAVELSCHLRSMAAVALCMERSTAVPYALRIPILSGLSTLCELFVALGTIVRGPHVADDDNDREERGVTPFESQASEPMSTRDLVRIAACRVLLSIATYPSLGQWHADLRDAGIVAVVQNVGRCYAISLRSEPGCFALDQLAREVASALAKTSGASRKNDEGAQANALLTTTTRPLSQLVRTARVYLQDPTFRSCDDTNTAVGLSQSLSSLRGTYRYDNEDGGHSVRIRSRDDDEGVDTRIAYSIGRAMEILEVVKPKQGRPPPRACRRRKAKIKARRKRKAKRKTQAPA